MAFSVVTIAAVALLPLAAPVAGMAADTPDPFLQTVDGRTAAPSDDGGIGGGGIGGGGIGAGGWMHGASISVGPDGVSITLPEAVAQGNVAAVAEAFLNTRAPGMCSHVFNFQKPHRRLTVGVAVMAQPDPGIPFWAAGTTRSVVIDYVPARAVHCIVPQDEGEPTN
jgi:hypothetical protein